MTLVIDFHAHVFEEIISNARLGNLRKHARNWIRPLANSIHGLQTQLRYLPEIVRKNLDEFSSLLPLPHLLVECTSSDLMDSMDEAGINQSLIIAHPPFISNDFIMELCSQNSRLIPAVNIPKSVNKPGLTLQRFADAGAKVLKIHTALDGESPSSPRYRALIKTATELGLPVIIHTGCIHAHFLYKYSQQAHADRFEKWFKAFPKTKFILAHMNFHNPDTALDLCEKYPNLWVDTSWQPAEVIGEAARRIGANRVLFGTDWPLVGNNQIIGRNRIQDCIETGLLNEEQAKLILGENAVKLLGIQVHAH